MENEAPVAFPPKTVQNGTPKRSVDGRRYSQTGVRAELLSDLAEVGALARRDKSYISTSIGEPRIDGECVAKTLLRIPVENLWDGAPDFHWTGSENWDPRMRRVPSTGVLELCR